MTPATLGPMACISRKLEGLFFWPTVLATRAAMGTAETPAEPIRGLTLPPVVLSIKPEFSIRYRWTDEEDTNAYFEFQIFTHELTGSTSLQITDFAEANEKHDSIDLWDTQIETLKRTLGI